MKPNRVTSLVLVKYFYKRFYLKLSQSQTNKKTGFRIILQFPQRYFWGIRVPQKYLYVISILRLCSFGNCVTDYAGFSEPFQKVLIILKTKLSLNYYQ
jgi:hypothetical protein